MAEKFKAFDRLPGDPEPAPAGGFKAVDDLPQSNTQEAAMGGGTLPPKPIFEGGTGLSKIFPGAPPVAVEGITDPDALDFARQVRESRDFALDTYFGQRGVRFESARGFAEAVPGGNKTAIRMLAARTVPDMFKEFKRLHPEGEIRRLRDPSNPNQIMFIGRREPSEPFREILPSPTKRLGDITGGDVVRGARARPFTTAAGILAGVRAGPLRVLAGTAAGATVDEIIASYENINNRPLGHKAQEVAIVSGMTAALQFILAPKVPGTRGAIDFTLTPGALDREVVKLSKEASELGLPRLKAGQALRSPRLEAEAGQAFGITAVGREALTDQQRRALQFLESRVSQEGYAGLTETQLDVLVALWDKAIKGTFGNVKSMSATDAAKQFQLMAQRFTEAAKIRGDRLYRKAFEISSNVEFLVHDSIAAAEAFRKGILARGAVDEEVVTEMAKQIKAAGVDIHSPNFKGTSLAQIKEMVREDLRQSVNVGHKPSGALASVIDDLLKIDPRLVKNEGFEAFEQIKALRERVGALTQSDDPFERRAASVIYANLTRSLENPLGQTAAANSPAFLKAWTTATRYDAVRRGVTFHNNVMRLLHEGDPNKIVAQIFGQGGSGPSNVQVVKLMARLSKRAGAGEQRMFGRIKRAFINDMLAAPENIGSRLRAFNRTEGGRAALEAWLEPAEIKAMETVAHMFRRLNTSTINKEATRTLHAAERAVKIAESESPEFLEETLRMAARQAKKPMHKTPEAKAIRDGLFLRILQDSTEEVSAGVKVLNPTKFQKNIKRMQQLFEKVPEIVSQKELAEFNTIIKWSTPFTKGSIDVGGAMQRGEVAATGTAALAGLKPGKFIRGRQHVFGLWITAKIYSSPVGRRIMSHMDANSTPKEAMRLFARAAFHTLRNVSIRPDEAEE